MYRGSGFALEVEEGEVGLGHGSAGFVPVVGNRLLLSAVEGDGATPESLPRCARIAGADEGENIGELFGRAARIDVLGGEAGREEVERFLNEP